MIVGLGLVACTRENPEFETGPRDPGSSTAPSTESDTLDGTDVTGPAGEETGGGTTAAADESTSSPAETGSQECVPEFLPRFGLGAKPAIEVPDCTAPVMFGVRPVMEVPGGILVRMCEDCPCFEPAGVLRELYPEVPPPDGLPECFRMYIDPGPGDGMFCDLDAYSYVVEALTVAVVSNVVDPDLPEPFDFVLADTPSELCDAGCEPKPSGHYALRALTGDTVPITGDVEILPSADQDYEVQNFESGLNAQCQEVGRWIAMPFL